MNTEEQSTEPTDTVEPVAPETEAPDTDDLDKWKKHARLWERRAAENLELAQANEAAAKRVAEMDEAAKTELEKANERAERAEAELASTKFAALKASIAAEHGVSAEDAELLMTSTDEEGLRAQAQALASRAPKDETPRIGFGVDGLQDRNQGQGETSIDSFARDFFGV